MSSVSNIYYLCAYVYLAFILVNNLHFNAQILTPQFSVLFYCTSKIFIVLNLRPHIKYWPLLTQPIVSSNTMLHWQNVLLNSDVNCKSRTVLDDLQSKREREQKMPAPLSLSPSIMPSMYVKIYCTVNVVYITLLHA